MVGDDVTIEAVINIAASAQDGYRTVVVTNGTQALTGNFLVTAPAPPPTPYIWYLSPGSALPGQTLTVSINGAYTNWQPGTGEACSQSGTTLTGFNADVTVNCFQVLGPTTGRPPTSPSARRLRHQPATSPSPRQLTAMYPAGEVEQNRELRRGDRAADIEGVVDPGSGLQGATNLSCQHPRSQYTTFDNTTTFSFGPNVIVNGPPVILGPTIATQSISIPILAPLGGVGVVANTPDAAPIAQSVGGAGFSITPSLALISAITPNTSAQGTTPTVEMTGMPEHAFGTAQRHSVLAIGIVGDQHHGELRNRCNTDTGHTGLRRSRDRPAQQHTPYG